MVMMYERLRHQIDTKSSMSEMKEKKRAVSGGGKAWKSRWAQRVAVLLALTMYDRLVNDRGAANALVVCATRESEYRAVCPHPFAIHILDCRDPAAASRLLADAAAGATPAVDETS